MKRTVIAFALALVASLSSAADTDDIKREIAKRHDEAVKRLQDWIALPSIAAENRNYPAGADYMAKLARDAGFQQATVITTDGKPGVYATLDAGAKKTDRRISVRSFVDRKSKPRCEKRPAYSCRQPHKTSTASSPSPSAPKAWSSSSWYPAAKNGAAVRPKTSIHH